jgi:hypothetical protein
LARRGKTSPKEEIKTTPKGVILQRLLLVSLRVRDTKRHVSTTESPKEDSEARAERNTKRRFAAFSKRRKLQPPPRQKSSKHLLVF